MTEVRDMPCFHPLHYGEYACRGVLPNSCVCINKIIRCGNFLFDKNICTPLIIRI